MPELRADWSPQVRLPREAELHGQHHLSCVVTLAIWLVTALTDNEVPTGGTTVRDLLGALVRVLAAAAAAAMLSTVNMRYVFILNTRTWSGELIDCAATHAGARRRRPPRPASRQAQAPMTTAAVTTTPDRGSAVPLAVRLPGVRGTMTAIMTAAAAVVVVAAVAAALVVRHHGLANVPIVLTKTERMGETRTTAAAAAAARNHGYGGSAPPGPLLLLGNRLPAPRVSGAYPGYAAYGAPPAWEHLHPPTPSWRSRCSWNRRWSECTHPTVFQRTTSASFWRRSSATTPERPASSPPLVPSGLGENTRLFLLHDISQKLYQGFFVSSKAASSLRAES